MSLNNGVSVSDTLSLGGTLLFCHKERISTIFGAQPLNPSKTVIITGGNSGLGCECAQTLAAEGDWALVIASRNPTRVQEAVDQLKVKTGHPVVYPMILDLASTDSVRQSAAAFPKLDLPPLHAIVCNAGLSPGQNGQTDDGIDLTFGVNHLGHYLLVHLLSEQLVEAGRVVFVSSGTHIPEHKLARRFGVPMPKYTTAQNLAYPDDAPEEAFIKNPAQRYSTSKLCNMLCAYELDRQFQAIGKPVSVFGIDPGLMPGTGLARDMPSWLVKGIFVPLVSLMERWVDGIRFPKQSGKDLARLVLDESLAGKSGLYFDGEKEARSSDDSYDLAKAADLWNTSSELCKLKANETMLPTHITR